MATSVKEIENAVESLVNILYLIETDDKGERRFFHWRDSAAARSLMDLPETDGILNSLASYDLVYLSAITLSLYDEKGRER